MAIEFGFWVLFGIFILFRVGFVVFGVEFHFFRVLVFRFVFVNFNFGFPKTEFLIPNRFKGFNSPSFTFQVIIKVIIKVATAKGLFSLAKGFPPLCPLSFKLAGLHDF